MELLDFRTSIETTLVDVLGFYTLSNGSETPAIAVRSEGESIKPGTEVSGLECVILREPSLRAVRQYTKVQAQSKWTLYLVDWEGGNLEDAAAAILWEWPSARVFDAQTPSGLGPKAQMRVEITTDPEAHL